eukprot:11156006-Lingulodinium_polyedra.AAC.1
MHDTPYAIYHTIRHSPYAIYHVGRGGGWSHGSVSGVPCAAGRPAGRANNPIIPERRTLAEAT